MGSFYHILKGNRSQYMPTRLIFYDCETTKEVVKKNVFKHHLKLGWACAVTRYNSGKRINEKWRSFKRKDDFWRFVLSYSHKKTRLFLIAHNQHFDFTVVDGFNYLTKRGWKMSTPILDSQLFIVTFRKAGSSIVVLDSLNWFKFSVKELGDSIGLKKGKIDFDTCSDAELSEYCKRDVEIIKEMLLQYIEFLIKYDLGNFQKTTPSQSFTAFRHRFMQDQIFIHANPQVALLERQSYRGGRNEAFFIGKVPVKVLGLDFNSLYPSVMLEAELPAKLIKYTHCITVNLLEVYLRDYCVTAHVNITVTEPCIALKKERLLFPTGTFDVTLTTPELLYVLEHHKINSVECAAIYEKARIFEGYVTELYSLRLDFKRENNEVYDLLTKLFLNSLYGKFGQQNETINCVGECPAGVVLYERCIDYETSRKYLRWSFGGKVYERSGLKTEARHSFVGIAAHITAYARMRLWHAIKLAEPSNVFYCDTDSLYTNIDGYKRLKPLIDSEKLGALKVEKRNKSMTIYGCKDYRLGRTAVIKGIKKGSKRLKKNKYKQTRFLKFRSLLRRGSLDAPIEELYSKELKRIYKKGVVDDSGYVTPFSFPLSPPL